MSMQEPANHYRLGLKLGTYCDNATRLGDFHPPDPLTTEPLRFKKKRGRANVVHKL